MNKKQLIKTAFISSPIMAAFELSPAFFLNDDSPISFLGGVFVVTFITLLLWFFNIYIYSVFEEKQVKNQWKVSLLSYLFAMFTIALFIIFASEFQPSREKTPPLLFPFINAIALNTIILIIINSIANRSKKEQTERELSILKIKNLEAEQQQLIQQLQPHFLFNALSTLKSLINTNAEQTEEYLVRLSDFLRISVSSHANKLVMLDEELKFTNDYIKLQQIRFANSFFCEIDIPDFAQQSFVIPVYALQTLVENAIKHNAFTATKPLYLSIVLKNTSIEVKNNKIPKATENKSGLGLGNLDKRYFLIAGEHIVIDNKPDYFLVSIKLIKKE
ncbi:MAG: sensor histidine kinase [Bacteroidales bacterium]